MSLLTADDLAERWGLSTARVRKLVKHEGLPYLSFQREKPGRMQISWAFIRFDPEAVEEWQASRARTFAEPDRPAPKTVVFRKLGAI